MRGRLSTAGIILLALLLLSGTAVSANAMLAGSNSSDQAPIQPPIPSSPERGEPVEATSLEEAEAIMGVDIPVPAYLPSGYQIQYIAVESTRLALLYSDEPYIYPSAGQIGDTWEKAFQRPGGAKLLLDIRMVTRMPSPGWWVEVDQGRTDLSGDVVDLGQVNGLLVDPAAIEDEQLPDNVERWLPPGGLDDVWQLSWWQDGLRYILKAPKTMSKWEVLKIATSVPKQHQVNEVSLLQAEASLGTNLSDIDLNEGYEVHRIFLWDNRSAYLGDMTCSNSFLMVVN